MHAATWESLNRFVQLGELQLATLECVVRVAPCAVALQPVDFEVVTEPGARVRAWLRGAESSAPLRLDANGRGSFVPARPGSYRVIAQATHDSPMSGTPMDGQAEALVKVAAPRMVIEVQPMVARGPAGSTASFRWDVRHAASIQLRAPLRDEVARVGQRGALEVEIDAVAETFQLVAVAMDGTEKVIQFSTQPAFESLDTRLGEAIARLDRPWR